jgi:acetolactate synthase-1/2/3 large subunit
MDTSDKDNIMEIEQKQLTMSPKKIKVEVSGSVALLEALIMEGTNVIFGYPGGAIMPIYDALYDYREKLNHILVRHEQGGIHAGQGFARTSGKVGVVFATSGPGATNLVTGLADAMIDSTPLVVSQDRYLHTYSVLMHFRKQM